MTEANEYGRALFLITEEDATTEKVLADVRMAESVISANPDYVKLLNSPAIPGDERVGLVDKAFSGLDVNLINLIKILTEKRLVNLFGKVAEFYCSLYDESRGIVRVEAVSAIPLTKDQSEKLGKKLSAMISKTVIVRNTVDPSILGGMKLRYQGIQLDGSVKTRLDKFEEALKNTVI